MSCSCHPLSIEDVPPNWNPDCQDHGLKSAWYCSPEQVERRRIQSERLRDLQRQAREAREKAREARESSWP